MVVTGQSASASDQPLSAFGPDFPFGHSNWIAHSSGLGSLPPGARGAEVAVVGAGIAGLVAAYELMKLGFKPVVFEAGRLGGRLRSESFSAMPEIVAELGAMRFPTSGSTFYHYLDLLGLETKPFPNPLTEAAPTTVVDIEGETHLAETIEDLPEIFGQVADAWEAALEDAGIPALKTAVAARDTATIQRLWSKLVEEWDDRSFWDFVSSSRSFRALSYRHREIFGQVGFGTGGWDSDFPNSMLEIFRVVMSEFEENQRLVVGGVEQLPRGLWTHEPESLAHWEPGTSLSKLHAGAPRPRVASIGRGKNGRLNITDRWGNGHLFDAAVVTTQSWLLTTNIDVDESLFSYKLWMALDRTRYMQSSKTFVMVDRPFWNEINSVTRKPELSMTLTDRNTRGTYLFDNGPDKPGVICLSYAWMSDALKVLPKSADERAALALDTLEKIYPATNIRGHVIGEPITVSWEADPDFLGAFKGALPGHYRYNRRMYAHFMQDDLPAEQRGIFLAGDDVSWTPGWAEGAVTTALNAVWGVLRHFGGSTPEDNRGPGDVFAKIGPLELED
ncbi:MAG: monoamine oxidase [Acidimicrobiales bacterium]